MRGLLSLSRGSGGYQGGYQDCRGGLEATKGVIGTIEGV